MFLVFSGLAVVAIDVAQALGAFLQSFLAFRDPIEAIFLVLSNVEACGSVKTIFVFTPLFFCYLSCLYTLNVSYCCQSSGRVWDS
jgi:hypothetical protein